MEPLREGKFLLAEGQQLLAAVQRLPAPGATLPAEVVRWLWLIPFTLHWYGKDLPRSVDEDEFRQLEEDLYDCCARYLGEP